MIWIVFFFLVLTVIGIGYALNYAAVNIAEIKKSCKCVCEPIQ
jgi:hypothetical protein